MIKLTIANLFKLMYVVVGVVLFHFRAICHTQLRLKSVPVWTCECWNGDIRALRFLGKPNFKGHILKHTHRHNAAAQRHKPTKKMLHSFVHFMNELNFGFKTCCIEMWSGEQNHVVCFLFFFRFGWCRSRFLSWFCRLHLIIGHIREKKHTLNTEKKRADDTSFNLTKVE